MTNIYDIFPESIVEVSPQDLNVGSSVLDYFVHTNWGKTVSLIKREKGSRRVLISEYNVVEDEDQLRMDISGCICAIPQTSDDFQKASEILAGVTN
jgi:hypothetical protein|tara:strand:+ start:940 stop:1227 length:288 start_codon:yes stop_codon:yes gene_type:complete